MNNNWKKNIILFLTSQTISLFGSMLVQYAITWYITLKTQSGVMMTISIICDFLPTFLLSPFAGVWADRYDRKKLIILSDSIIAIATLILSILFFMGYDAIWLFFVAASIRALGSGIQTPVVGAFLPQLVPEDKLTKVNAVNSSIQSLIMLISPMLSGALLTMSAMGIIFFIDVITAVIAVFILLLFLHVPAHAKALQKQSTAYFSDMKEGLKYIKNHGFIKILFFFIAIFFILSAPLSFLTSLHVTRSFGNEVWRLTAVQITFSVGMMLGGVMAASWGGFKNKVHTLIISILIIGAGTFALGAISFFWVYTFLMCFIGLVLTFLDTQFVALLQSEAEEDFLGRIFGVLGMIQSIIMPAAMLIYGPLADYVKIDLIFMGVGLLIFILSILMLGNKNMLWNNI